MLVNANTSTRKANWLPGTGGRAGSQRGMSKLLRVMDRIIVLTVVLIAWVSTHTQTHQTVPFNYVLFIIYQLYLNKGRQKE
jgi:hypothetical protein